jgi:hypothetical protein
MSVSHNEHVFDQYKMTMIHRSYMDQNGLWGGLKKCKIEIKNKIQSMIFQAYYIIKNINEIQSIKYRLNSFYDEVLIQVYFKPNV